MNFAGLIAKQSRAVIVTILLLCAAGIYAAWQLPTAIFPNTDFPRIVVIVDNGEVPADQMLVSVTQPIEEAMNGIPGIQRIKSTTARGSVDINLFFDWNTDIIQTQQIVQGRLAQLSLPPTASIRRVDRLTFAVFPISGYSLTSDKFDTAALRKIGRVHSFVRDLPGSPGVADVSVQGGSVREFHIEVDPQRLAARAVTIQQVTDAVKNSNVLASPGLVEENHRLELVLVSGQATTPDELGSVVVGNVNGANVPVSDIATVTRRPGTELHHRHCRRP